MGGRKPDHMQAGTDDKWRVVTSVRGRWIEWAEANSRSPLRCAAAGMTIRAKNQ